MQFFYLKNGIMGTIITAAILLGFIALITGLLMFVHKRDSKRESEKTG
jgi:hypothetical protein